MDEISNIISFYRDCYQFDLKGIRIRNFLSNQCEKRFIPSNNEFFQENYTGIPVQTSWAQGVENTLFLHSKDKALYAGSIFIKGHQNNIGKKSVAYVPLYIHELKLAFEHEVFVISVMDTFINPDFIQLANSMDENLDLKADFLDNAIPNNPFGFENLVLLQEFFTNIFPNWDSNDISNYHLRDFDFEKHLVKIKKSKTGILKIHAGLMYGIFNKPKGSVGVLDELSQLCETKKSSKLLELFFKFRDFEHSDITERKIYVPTSLSRSQEYSFFKSDVHPISLIIGPPGTGKSFTISALALDAIINNQSVLIVSRNTQACRVISKTIEHDFKIKGSIVKADTQRYKIGLISKLNKIVDKYKAFSRHPNDIALRIDKLDRGIQETTQLMLKAEQEELYWGQFYSEYQDGFFTKLKDKWIQYRKRNSIPIWKLNDSLIHNQRERIRLIKKYIVLRNNKNLHNVLRKKRTHFIHLINALREKNSTLLEEKFNLINFKLVLEALPLWTSTIKGISKNLPFEQDLFDIVIVDEASQCDIASMIPIMYRAKKLIVVGDPHQLRHITFLSDKKQEELKLKYEINRHIPDYRRDSLIDWTNKLLESQDQITFLDEHFRSKSDLIRFSNEKFYENSLKIIRSNPISDLISSIQLMPTTGTRNAKGINEIEAQKVLDHLRTIVSDYENIDRRLAVSVGIISPFSQQVSYIKSQISKQFTFDEIKKFDLLIGTPHHFQGEERDIVMISFAMDNKAHYGTIHYLNKPDVFNVLITRARNKQLLFISFEVKNLSSNSLLKEYLELKLNESLVNQSSQAYDEFYNEVKAFLVQSGYENIYNSMTVSGVQMDIVIISDGSYFCIDLIGFPGEFEEQFSLENIKMLNRMNTPIFFIPYSNWCLERKIIQRNLLNFIQSSNGI